MAVQRSFFDWSKSGLPTGVAPYTRLSPNSRLIADHLIATFGGQIVGGYSVRTIREGSTISPHSYGAPVDWRYEPEWLDPKRPATTVPRQTVLDLIVPWLINYSAELGIDAIHDYVGDRIWRAGRTSNVGDAHGSWWKKQNGSGAQMGESWARWLHIESHRDRWAGTTPLDRRGIPLVGQPTPAPPPSPEPTPIPAPTEEDYMIPAVCKTTDGAHLVQFQVRGPVHSMGARSTGHDFDTAEVFGRGAGKAFDVGTQRVVSWSIDSPGSWAAVVPSLTVAEARERFGI